MSEQEPSFGDLAWANKINASKKYDNSSLLVFSPHPTKTINPLFKSYHWYRIGKGQSSYFQFFPQVDAWLAQAKEEGWRPVVCAPNRCIAYALSRLHRLSDPDNANVPFHEILNGFPELRQNLPRNFRYELVLYCGWVIDDEFCSGIVRRCTNEQGKFELELLSKEDEGTLKELRDLADFEPDFAVKV